MAECCLIGALANLATICNDGTSVMGDIIRFIREEFGYLSSSNYIGNKEEMKDKIFGLVDLIASVNVRVYNDERNLQVIKEEVRKWTEQAKDILNRAFEYDKPRVCCIDWLCPDVMERYLWNKWSKKEMIPHIAQHHSGGQFDSVSIPPDPATYTPRFPTSFEGLDSRKQLSQKIVEALNDDTVKLVGLWGLGGMGKTTMARAICQKAEQKDGLHFDEIVFLYVTGAPDTRKVQQSIADSLGLKLEANDDDFKRASVLRKRLKLRDHVLLILDDVWEPLNLKELGISLEASQENKRCKVLFTSRSRDTCNQMKPQEDFEISELPPDEAWDFFQQVSGERFARDHDLYQVARDVVERYQGLPLSIVKLAELLRVEDDRHKWRDILDRIFTTSSKGLNSRKKLSQDIIEALKDDSVQLVGLHGFGGAGKTTMAREIQQKAEQKDGIHFDKVVFVTVTRTPDTRKVQQSIADSLDLKLEENDDLSRRADALRARLKLRDHVLLILDDVWKQLDLKELGIPLEAGQENKKCKVFFTSRNKDTCNRMKPQPQKVIKIDELPCDEAWNLFQQESDRCFAPGDDLYQVASDIVQSCKGLTLAIVTIAKLLRGENYKKTWEDILQRLKTGDLDDEYSTVYEILAQSYNFIGSDEKKRVFLLCCLFPEDDEIEIEVLLRFGIGLNIFAISSTLNILRDRTYSCVEMLKNRHLLDGGRDKRFVKMHDLVRDTGLKIASKGENVFVVGHGGEEVRWPREPECCTRISLKYHEKLQIPRGLRCPKLELLQLIGFSEPLMFPTNFFEGMGKLKVLILKRMQIQSYPFEVSKELQSLSLDSCKFPIGVPPSIGNLGELTVLTFVNCYFEILPEEIGKLTQLRVLDLTLCFRLHTIAPGVLKSLIHLEELHMRRCEELNMECLRELSSLSRLAALDIERHSEWKDMDDLYIVYGKLTRFNIRVRNFSFDWDDLGNTLKLSYVTLREEGIEVLFSKAKMLHLSLCHFETRTCLNKSEAEDFSELRKLTLINCNRLVHLVQINKQEPSNVFKTLESLYLDGMPDLEEIFGGFFKCGEIRELNGLLPSFQNLRYLGISNCRRLKRLFPISKGLMKLEKLKIVDCVSMETIFWVQRREGEENAVMNVVEFPELKRLELKSLPNVTEICEGGAHSVMLPRLTELVLRKVPKLTIPGFLNEKIVLTNQLENLYVDSMHQVVHIDVHMDTGVFKLRRIELISCDGLVATVASSHVIQKLMFLKVIKIWGCPTVEVMFDLEGMIVQEAPPTVAVMDSLTNLELANLPRMTHVWKHVPQGFEGFKNLTVISLEDCDSIGPSLFSPLIVKLLVQLQRLIISRCEKMEVIVNEDDEVDPVTTVLPHKLGFPSLKFLKLVDLELLRCFCSEPRDFVWPSLKSVEIRDCPQLTTFTVGKSFMPSLRNKVDFNAAVERRGEEEEENAVMNVVEFPQLKYLVLKDLPRVTEICRGVDSVMLPRLTRLQLINVPKLTAPNAGKILLTSQLEYLSVGNMHLKGIQIDEHLDTGVLNLWDMCLIDCDGLATVASSRVIQKLVSLQVIKIEKCPTVEVVFDLQGVINVQESPAVAVMDSLTELKLVYLPRMTHVWKHVPKGFEGFKNLTEISLEDCNSIGPSLFSPLIVKLMVQLQRLSISRCEKMEVIVNEDEADPVATVVPHELEFPNLFYLQLEDLRILKCFCSEPCDFVWPSLKLVDIRDCPQLMTFTVGESFAPSLWGIDDLNAAVKDQLPQRNICLGIPFTTESSESDKNSERDENSEYDENSECDEDSERDENSEYDEDS